MYGYLASSLPFLVTMAICSSVPSITSIFTPAPSMLTSGVIASSGSTPLGSITGFFFLLTPLWKAAMILASVTSFACVW